MRLNSAKRTTRADPFQLNMSEPAVTAYLISLAQAQGVIPPYNPYFPALPVSAPPLLPRYSPYPPSLASLPAWNKPNHHLGLMSPTRVPVTHPCLHVNPPHEYSPPLSSYSSSPSPSPKKQIFRPYIDQ